MSIVDNLKRWMHPEDEEDVDVEDEDMTSAWATTGRSDFKESEKKEVSIRTTAQLKVLVCQPKKLEDVPGVADDLKRGMTIVLNVETLEREVARRILDVVSGVAYALDANITRIASNTYMILPFDVEFEGGLMDELTNNGILHTGRSFGV
jgi:cell division inhibitor SepF